MEQEKLEALIQKILTDPRILELLRNSLEGSAGICKADAESSVLNAAETREALDQIPPVWIGKRYCQEFPGGEASCHDTLSSEQAAAGSWDLIRVFQPSLSFIAKLATGVADEPLLKLIQQKLAAGSCRIELAELSNIESIGSAPYRRLFEGYLATLRSFGVSVEEKVQTVKGFSSVQQPAGVSVQSGTPQEIAVSGRRLGKTTVLASAPAPALGLWPYKALTERDLLDIEKGTVLTIGRKCIVTSLAEDMARRKSIGICREGEGQ